MTASLRGSAVAGAQRARLLLHARKQAPECSAGARMLDDITYMDLISKFRRILRCYCSPVGTVPTQSAAVVAPQSQLARLRSYEFVASRYVR